MGGGMRASGTSSVSVAVPVGSMGAIRSGAQDEFVDILDAGLAAQVVESLAQFRGEKLGQAAAQRACLGMPVRRSICVFQLSTRSSRSAARMPTLIDSTMFSLNSFSRSYSSTLRCKERYRRAFSMAMLTYPESVTSSSTSSLERKSPLSVRLRPRYAMVRPRTVQGK